MPYLFAAIILLWAGGRFLLHPRAVLKSKKGWDRTFYISVGLWFISILLLIPALIIELKTTFYYSYELLWGSVGIMVALGLWVVGLLCYAGIMGITQKSSGKFEVNNKPAVKDLPQIDVINALRAYKSRKAEEYGIETIGLFGSSARGRQSAESAIDIFIVTNEPGHSARCPFKEELEKELGHKVNVAFLSAQTLPSFEENMKDIICV